MRMSTTREPEDPETELSVSSLLSALLFWASPLWTGNRISWGGCSDHGRSAVFLNRMTTQLAVKVKNHTQGTPLSHKAPGFGKTYLATSASTQSGGRSTKSAMSNGLYGFNMVQWYHTGIIPEVVETPHVYHSKWGHSNCSGSM